MDSQSIKSTLKLPNLLNLGAILAGEYGEITLPLKSTTVSFLELELSKKSVDAGFFLLKEGTDDCTNFIKLVLKPGIVCHIIVASYPKQLSKSTIFNGELFVNSEGSLHTIKLTCKVEIPRIHCKKMLINTSTNEKLLRIIINKAVTSEGRVTLNNLEEYSLDLVLGLLVKNTIQSKQSPFIMKVHPEKITADSNQPFTFFVSIATNIGFQGEFKGIKRCMFRNVITFKINEVLIWCLPVEIIVIFVKQPEIKQ